MRLRLVWRKSGRELLRKVADSITSVKRRLRKENSRKKRLLMDVLFEEGINDDRSEFFGRFIRF